MAVVGEAHIVVRAITNQVRDDIRNGLRDVDKEFEKTGRDSGSKLSDAFKKSSGGGGGLFDSLKKEADAARGKLSGLITTGYMVGPAIVGIVSALGAAGAGLFALGAQAAAAAPALLSLVNVFTAVAQGAVVLKMAFSGIGAAISAGANQSGKAAQDNSKQIEAAQKRVEAAKARIAAQKDENDRQELAASKAHDAAIDREKAAYESIAEAKLQEIEATDAVAKAQLKLSDARDDATESLQQLRFELEQTVLSEQRAVLGFEDARENLAKVANLPPNNRQRREAELAFAEAELSLRRAKDNTLDTQKEVDTANAKGIDGSEQVLSAKERVTDAEKALAKATAGVTTATNNHIAAQKASKDAEEELDAVKKRSVTQMALVKEAYAEAKSDLEDIKNGSNDAGGGVDKFAEAMAKLAPAGQSFVTMILGMKDQFTELKKSVQQEFFSRINDDVKALSETYLPMLEKRLPETSAVLAGVAEKLMGVFNDPENVAAIDRIFGSNTRIIGDLGTAVSNLASIFIDLLDAAAPLAEELATWVKNLTEGWKETVEADKKSGDLKTTLDTAAGVVRILAGLFGDLFGAIKNIGGAAAGPGSGGEMLLGFLREAVAGWKTFTGSVEGQNELKQFFKDVAPVAKEIFGLIGDIGGAFFETTKAAVAGTTGFIDGSQVTTKDSPLLAFFKSLREGFEAVASTGPDLVTTLPIIGEFLKSVAEGFAALTSSGAIDTFFTVLKDAAAEVNKVVQNPLFLEIFAIVAPLLAGAKALDLIFKASRFLVMGTLVSPIMAIVSPIQKLNKAFKDGGDQTKWFVRFLKPLGLAGTGPLALVALAIAGVVAAFIAMWNESEIFREAIKELVDKVIAKAIEIFEKLKTKVDEALESVGGGEGVINGLKTAFKFLGDFLGTYLIPAIEDRLMIAFEILGAVIGTIIDFIGNLIRAWQDIIAGFQEGDLGKVLSGIWAAITAGITAFLNTILEYFGTSLGEIWDKVKQWVLDLGTTISELPGKVGEWLAGVWDSIWTFLQEQWDRIVAFYGPGGTMQTELLKLAARVYQWLRGVWDSFYEFLMGPDGVWSRITKALGPNGTIATFIRGIQKSIIGWLRGVWDSFYDFLMGPDGVWSRITGVFGPNGTIATFIRGLGRSVATWAANIWDGLGDSFVNILKAIVTAWNNLRLGPITMPDNGFTQFLGVAGKDFAIDTPNLPVPTRLAAGGIVPSRFGGIAAILGEAGRDERVEPLDPDGLSKRDKAMINFLTGGGGGATINVYPSAGMNERELAEMVSQKLAFTMRRGGI